jgi:hypothetical protein
VTQVSGATIYNLPIDLPVNLVSVDGADDVWVSDNAHLVEIQPTAKSDCSAGCVQISPSCPNNPNLADFAIDAKGGVWLTSGCGGGHDTVFGLSGGTTPTVAFPTSAELNAGTTFASELAELPAGPLALNNAGALVVGGGIVTLPNSSNVDTQFELYAVSTSGSYVGSIIGSKVESASSAAAVIVTSVAVDGAGNVWALGGGNGSGDPFATPTASMVLVQFPPSGAPIVRSGNGLDATTARRSLAIDGSGNVFVITVSSAGIATDSVFFMPSASPANCSSGCVLYSAPWMTGLNGVAVDGAGNLWASVVVAVPPTWPLNASTSGFNGVLKIKPGAAADCSAGCSLYTASALLNANLPEPGGIGIDSSGAVWVAEGLSATQWAMVKLPGIAAPTTNPIVSQKR